MAPPDPALQRAPSLAAKLGLVSLIVCIAGLTPVAARDAMKEMPPFSTGLVRFAIAAGLLTSTWLAWRRAESKLARPIGRRDWPLFLLAAALCVPVNQACFLKGVKLANASHAGLFYGLNPVLVYLFTLALGRTRRSVRMGLAAVLAFLGAAAIAWTGLRTEHRLSFFAGDLLLLGAIASWAAYTVAAVPLAARYGALRSVSIVLVAGVVLYTPAYLVDGRELDFAALSWRALGGFAFITLLTGYVNYLLWMVAWARIDVNRLAVATNTAPIISVAAAYFWQHEPLTGGLLVGAALILAAITLANWPRVRALWGARRPTPM